MTLPAIPVSDLVGKLKESKQIGHGTKPQNKAPK
jgi:hypothetical protein